MSQGQRFLVDPRSSTCVQTFEIFKPIELRDFIHVTVSSDGEFQVDLPRFRLHFLLKKGQLECPELGTVVSQSQAIGTFYELNNKLVMNGLGDLSSKNHLFVLIPYGKVSTVCVGDINEVHVDPGRLKTVRYSLFRLDQRLRQIRSSADSSANFYKAYLHAITSKVLPDPFTSTTGVEGALSCLLEARA